MIDINLRSSALVIKSADISILNFLDKSNILSLDNVLNLPSSWAGRSLPRSTVAGGCWRPATHPRTTFPRRRSWTAPYAPRRDRRGASKGRGVLFRPGRRRTRRRTGRLDVSGTHARFRTARRRRRRDGGTRRPLHRQRRAGRVATRCFYGG